MKTKIHPPSLFYETEKQELLKNFTKIGKAIYKSDQKFEIEYCVERSILNNKLGRVYIITSDNEVKKIGGSADKGGIRSTLSAYQNGLHISNSSSDRSIGICMLIIDELKKGKEVLFYVMFSDSTTQNVRGLFSTEIVMINHFKETELLCLKDYLKVFQQYPLWNFKEANREIPIQKRIQSHRTDREQLRTKRKIDEAKQKDGVSQ